LEEQPPESRQIYDVWDFPRTTRNNAYFGQMPVQIVENLLWLYTKEGDTVVDPFAGGGTTIDVATAMNRTIWASDLSPVRDDIHQHDITTGWPEDAPDATLIILDPPYWRQAKGKYSDKTEDLANQTLAEFNDSWAQTIAACAPHTKYLAFIISASQKSWRVTDHAHDFYNECQRQGLTLHRRIIVPYQTQQTSGFHVVLARSKRQLLTKYRDLVVMEAP
jgi:DNA modification methylase